MRLCLDANVLFPTVMREVLLGAARAGLFEPVWSPRILEEWALAARKIGPEGEMIARGEIALLGAAWPKAAVSHNESEETRLWLPDPADVHVLAAAIKSSSDGIVTMNAKDFPRNILAEEGLQRYDPDGLLMGFTAAHFDQMQKIARAVCAEAERLSGEPKDLRKLMKKARLPRFGKTVSS